MSAELLSKYLPSGKNSTLLLILFIGSIAIVTDLLIGKLHLTLIMFTGLSISALLTKWGIKKLEGFKVQQIIRKEGPNSHQMKVY